MVHDLQYELEVIKAFFLNGNDWVARKLADQEADLAQIPEPDNDIIEQIMTAPEGAEALENLILRAVVGELNSLYEFALQQAWIRLCGLNVPNNKGDADESVFVANRQHLEDSLKSLLADKNLSINNNWPNQEKILEIKELAEGFKHRHRLQPLPESCYPAKYKRRAIRRVNSEISSEDYPLVGYDLSQAQISEYIQAIEEFLHWLKSNRMLGFF